MGKKLKILFLTQWFTPEPDLKGLPFAKELQKRGHQVFVLTGFPNYPGGKIYPGYRLKLFQKEIIEGVEILRVWLYPSHDQSSLRRIFNYLSFAFSASFFGLFMIRQCDVMYVYHPPATVSIPAIILKLFRRIPIVYDIQDLWPDTLKSTGMLTNNFLLKTISLFLKVFYKYCDSIVVLSEGFRNKLLERNINASKIHKIHNWSQDIKDGIYDYGINNKKIILFAGTMGKAQALETILRAAEKVKFCQFHFVFIGGGIEVEQLKKISFEKELANVSFLDRVGSNEIGKYLSAADILLVHLKKDPLFKITIPSKIQAYMKIGKPILVGVEGDACELVMNAGCGFEFQPENVESLVYQLEKIEHLTKEELTTIGKKGKDYYEKHLTIEKGSDQFLDIFANVSSAN